MKEVIERIVALEARRQGVDPDLAVRLARHESGFNPQAVSSAGARGVMQLMPGTAKQLGVDAADVFDNVRGGVRYFKQQLDRFGDTRLALAAYNAGPGAVEKYGGVPPYKETQDYVRRIAGGAPGRGADATSQAQTSTQIPPEIRARMEALESRLAGGVEPETRGPAPAAEAPLPPLADQEAAAMRQALYGRPQGSPPALETDEATMGRVTPPPAPAPGPVPGVQPPPTAATQVQLLAQQEQQRLAAERDVGSLTVPAPPPAELGKAAAATGISMLGGLGGAALGTAIFPGAGTVAGEMAGSYAARKVNVALGLEKPGVAGDIAAAVLPGVGRLAGPVARAVIRRVPGAQGVLHTELAERLAGQAENLLPATPSQTIYTQVAQGTNPRIATRHLWRTAHEIIRDEMRLQPAMRNNELVRVAQDVFAMAQPGLGQVPMDQLYANQKRVGEMIRAARRAGGSEESGLRRLYGAFHDDLEAASTRGIPEAETLRTAIATSRREHAVDELQELFTPGRPGIVQRADGQISISGGRLQTRFEDRVRSDPVFRGSFQPEELAEIRELLREATRLKPLPPQSGVAFGSGPSLGRGALATAVTAAVTQDPALAAMMGTLATGAPHLLSWGFTTAPGRAIVRQAIREGHRLEDPVTLMSLAMALRPAAAQALGE